jgi:hypothetical protein
VSAWLSETSAAKQIRERSLATLTDIGRPIDCDWLATTIADLGGMSGVLADDDQHDRAAFYQAIGLFGGSPHRAGRHHRVQEKSESSDAQKVVA